MIPLNGIACAKRGETERKREIKGFDVNITNLERKKIWSKTVSHTSSLPLPLLHSAFYNDGRDQWEQHSGTLGSRIPLDTYHLHCRSVPHRSVTSFWKSMNKYLQILRFDYHTSQSFYGHFYCEIQNIAFSFNKSICHPFLSTVLRIYKHCDWERTEWIRIAMIRQQIIAWIFFSKNGMSVFHNFEMGDH